LPFQIPTRLAVGLGLESGLAVGYPATYAPSLKKLQGCWFPRIGFWNKANLGCEAGVEQNVAGMSIYGRKGMKIRAYLAGILKKIVARHKRHIVGAEYL